MKTQKGQIQNFIRNLKKRCQMELLFFQDVPRYLRKPFLYLLTKRIQDKRVEEISFKIENIRKELASRTGEIPIYLSPKPDTSTDNIIPKHGPIGMFSYEKIAHTGEKAYWGVFLHLCARETRAKTIVELGSCAGISASYLGASPYCKKLLSVEGSPELAKIAKETTAQVSNVIEIVNCLFDQAIDDYLPKLELPVDFCFIDGHHEKKATIHYFNRLRPYLRDGSIVVFDDISWSYDMRDAWTELVKESCFSHCFDLGIVGLCIYSETSRKPVYWDLQKILGKTKISTPKYW